MTTQSFLVRTVLSDGTHSDQLFTGITAEDAARGYFARVRESGNPKSYRRVYLYDQASQVPIDVYDAESGNVDPAAAPVAQDFATLPQDAAQPQWLGTPDVPSWQGVPTPAVMPQPGTQPDLRGNPAIGVVPAEQQNAPIVVQPQTLPPVEETQAGVSPEPAVTNETAAPASDPAGVNPLPPSNPPVS